MRITCLGASETVTGSRFLIETETTRILVDCGLFQGYKWLRRRNWQPIPLSIDTVDAIVLTHAHLDHSGYIPVLYKHGFRGPVWSHAATRSLCSVLWPDSGRIQEEDAKYFSRHKLSKHENPEPLYDEATARQALTLLRAREFHQPFSIGDLTVELIPSGHILGAASVIISDGKRRVAFSGDIGRPEDLMMHPPTPLPAVDCVFMEATYGDRLHQPDDPFATLAKVVNDTARKGGVLMIPSFAVGRAQLIQYMLCSLMEKGQIPRLPVFLDSPMAIRVSEAYTQFVSLHRLSAEQWHRVEQYITYTPGVEDSKAIASQIGPHIIVAGSGMATGGRILHHFKHHLADHRNTVLFAGHQAGGTRGAKMLQGMRQIKVHGDWLDVRATICNLDGLSGHADYAELKDWLDSSDLSPHTSIQLIHGEPDALEALRDHLLRTTSFAVDIPSHMSIVRL